VTATRRIAQCPVWSGDRFGRSFSSLKYGAPSVPAVTRCRTKRERQGGQWLRCPATLSRNCPPQACSENQEFYAAMRRPKNQRDRRRKKSGASRPAKRPLLSCREFPLNDDLGRRPATFRNNPSPHLPMIPIDLRGAAKQYRSEAHREKLA
jgi:hypothetical protein